MGIFSAVSTANPNGGGVYFLPGTYRVKIVACKSITTRMKENCFVIEAEIVNSSVPERAPGTKASQVINMKHDSAPGNIRGFLAAALNVPYEQVGEDEAEAAVSDLQPLSGTEMHLTCVMTTTKRNTPFTLHQWSFASEPGPRPVAVAAPVVPGNGGARPVAQWVVHPQNPAYEYNPQTNEVRQRQA